MNDKATIISLSEFSEFKIYFCTSLTALSFFPNNAVFDDSKRDRKRSFRIVYPFLNRQKCRFEKDIVRSNWCKHCLWCVRNIISAAFAALSCIHIITMQWKSTFHKLSCDIDDDNKSKLKEFSRDLYSHALISDFSYSDNTRFHYCRPSPKRRCWDCGPKVQKQSSIDGGKIFSIPKSQSENSTVSWGIVLVLSITVVPVFAKDMRGVPYAGM